MMNHNLDNLDEEMKALKEVMAAIEKLEPESQEKVLRCIAILLDIPLFTKDGD